MIYKKPTLNFIVIVFIILLLGCSSDKSGNSDLKANVAAFVSNNDQIVSFGYVDVNQLKNKSQITEVPEFKKAFQENIELIEDAIKLEDKSYYAFTGSIKDNGPEVNYLFLNIKNKKRLQDALEMMGFFFKKSKANPNLKIYDDESKALGFDDHTLVLVNANFDHNPKEMLLNAFSSFKVSEINQDVDEVLDTQDDIVMTTRLDRLYANTKDIAKRLSKEAEEKIKPLLKDGYSTLKIQFNKGDLIAKVDNSRVNEKLKAYSVFKEQGNDEISQSLGPDSSNFAMTLSLNMKHIEKLMDLLGEDESKHLIQHLYVPTIVKALIKSEGLSGLTSGDLGVMVSKEIDEKALDGLGLYNMNYFVGLGEKRQNVLNLIDTLAKADEIKDLGDEYYQIEQGVLKLKNDNLIYHNNSSKEKFQTGPIKVNKEVENFGEAPLSIFIDLSDDDINMTTQIPAPIQPLLNYATLTGNNDEIILKIQLKNTEVNVLKQMIDVFEENYKEEMINRGGVIPI